MAIDPAVLAKQKIHLVKRNSETRCSKCNRRTTRPEGICHPCASASNTLTTLSKMPTEEVAHLVRELKAELERRRKAIDEVLG